MESSQPHEREGATLDTVAADGFSERLASLETPSERRKAFIAASLHASTAERGTLLRTALGFSTDRQETMEIIATAGVFAESIPEEAAIIFTAHEIRPDDVEAEMQEFGVTFTRKNPLFLIGIRSQFKEKYSAARQEAKDAKGA